MKKRPTDNKSQSSANDQRDYNEPEQLSFLPPLPLIVSWPSPDTLPAKALARMLTGERINQISFGLNAWRLAAYIRSLKDDGWPVCRGDLPRPDRGRPYAEYWLTNRTIMAARDMARGAA
jgi:hypothetical protein